MTREEKECFQYGQTAAANHLQFAPCYDSRMKCMVGESRTPHGQERSSRNMTAWSAGYLKQYLSDGSLLDEAHFRSAAITFFPQIEGKAIDMWVEFARERVEAEQYVDFIEEPAATAVSRWYDTLMAGLVRAKENHGKEIAGKLYRLAEEGLCLYPYEMEEAAEQIKQGADVGTLGQLMRDGYLDSPPPFFPKLEETLEHGFQEHGMTLKML
ncbi:hypothetical protein [Feifania hominis]|uniref:Uncharacterized protein n=1 Tax=Feifania hominis TaxID=2763660 RepID=A0A926DDN1_9FIRM|nr:hypothetical protein [Feifania hominis]MBC8535927.1 hypothetical protein [Feifania hominis]